MKSELTFDANNKVADIMSGIQDKVLNGEVNPIQAAVFLKKLGKLADEFYKGEKGSVIKELVKDDIERSLEGKSLTVYGAHISMGSRSTYDYASSMHPEYLELLNIKSAVDKRLKELEKELKLIAESAYNAPVFAEGNMKIPSTKKSIKVHLTWSLEATDSDEYFEVEIPKKLTMSFPKFAKL